MTTPLDHRGCGMTTILLRLAPEWRCCWQTTCREQRCAHGILTAIGFLLAGAVFFYSLNLGPRCSNLYHPIGRGLPIHRTPSPCSSGSMVRDYSLLEDRVAPGASELCPQRHLQLASSRSKVVAVCRVCLVPRDSKFHDGVFVPVQEELISGSSSLARELLKSRANRWIFLN